MDTMSRRQDRSPDSPTYGNIYWRVGWTEVRDRNGVSFWSPEAGLIFLNYRDLLDDSVADTVEETLQLCVTGLDLHRPRWQYTNIFLLNILSRLTLASVLDRPDVLERAEEDWETWFTETGKGGFTEYNSPTYVVTALAPLGRMLDYAPVAMSKQVEQTLECLYADFCWHYHIPSGGLAGAMSRAYSGDWLNNSMTNHIAYQQLDEPQTARNLSGPFTASSTYLAPASIRAAATREKAGTTVRAAIPDLDISRETVFGRHFALGIKSGPAYGHQELPLTIAHPGKRQHLMYLHQESQVRSPTYASTAESNAVIVIDIPDSDPEAAPPHAWLKIRLGARTEFTRIEHGGADWDGDYLNVSDGKTLSLVTEYIAASFSFSVIAENQLTKDTAKVFLWDDYQTDQLTIEIIAWKPSQIGIAVGVLDGNTIPEVCPVTRTSSGFESITESGMIEVTRDTTVSNDEALLEAPGLIWRTGWQTQSA